MRNLIRAYETVIQNFSIKNMTDDEILANYRQSKTEVNFVFNGIIEIGDKAIDSAVKTLIDKAVEVLDQKKVKKIVPIVGRMFTDAHFDAGWIMENTERRYAEGRYKEKMIYSGKPGIEVCGKIVISPVANVFSGKRQENDKKVAQDENNHSL